eukprot:gene18092-20606_t
MHDEKFQKEIEDEFKRKAKAKGMTKAEFLEHLEYGGNSDPSIVDSDEEDDESDNEDEEEDKNDTSDNGNEDSGDDGSGNDGDDEKGDTLSVQLHVWYEIVTYRTVVLWNANNPFDSSFASSCLLQL